MHVPSYGATELPRRLRITAAPTIPAAVTAVLATVAAGIVGAAVILKRLGDSVAP